MRHILSIYRILLVVIFLAFFTWLVYQNTVVGGRLFVVKDFCNKSDFISNLYPENRVGGVEKELGDCFQRIFVEPAYFKVKVPRTFSKAGVTVVYKNPDQLVFQLGLMKKRINPLDWNFTLRLIGNKIFDNLDWYKLEEQGIVLWQKQKQYESIYEFVNNVPVDSKTATFYYKFSKEAIRNPTKVVEWNPNTKLEYVDYIISQYTPPKTINGWHKQTVEFLAGTEYMNDHFLEFMLSSPGLTENRHKIKIKRIEIELLRPPTNIKTFISDLKGYLIRKLQK
ncbi:hypothetical protein MYX07_01575 [Patescibacteria group bacterium AH-259-L07]|nr:hypothetical protein [Patescibacteria group bacterium AH-259-L07]